MTLFDSRSSGRSQRITSESGVAAIMALWVLMLLVMIVGTFSLSALHRQNTSSSSVKRFQAQQLTDAGVESWATVLKDDALLGDDGPAKEGVIPTEIMNQNVTGNVKINEIKASDNAAGLDPNEDVTCGVNAGIHVELVNTGSGPVEITGWFGRYIDLSEQMGPTEWTGGGYTQHSEIGATTSQSVYLCPLHGDEGCVDNGPNYHRFFAIGTKGDLATGGGPHDIRICTDELTPSQCESASNSNDEVVDWARTPNSCRGSPPAACGLTWQVYPDGSHGQKPSADRDLTNAPTNWSLAPCTMDATTLGATTNRGDTVVRPNASRDHYGAPQGSAVTEYNGQGVWIKRGDNQFEGMRFVQDEGTGGDAVFDFGSDITFAELSDYGLMNGQDGMFGGGPGGSPYCKKIRSVGSISGDRECAIGTPCQVSCNYKERFYIDTMNSTGAAIFTRAMSRDALGAVYDDADTAYVDRNGFRHSVPVIPMAIIMKNLGNSTDEFPLFRNADDRKIQVRVPQPMDQPLGAPPIPWEEFKSSDQNADPAADLNVVPEMDPFSLETESGEHGWLVRRTKSTNSMNGLLRADSSVATPDPGGYHEPPSWYTAGPSDDYDFNNQDKADSRLYVSEVYDTDLVRESTCNLKITSGRRGGGSPNFVEIFNVGPRGETLAEVIDSQYNGSNFVEQTRWSGSEYLGPGEYFVIAENTSIPSMYRDYVDGNLLTQSGDNDFGFKVINSDGDLCDVFGADNKWEQTNPADSDEVLGSGWYEDEPIEYNHATNAIIFWRKNSEEYGKYVPRDENDNADDFVFKDPLGYHGNTMYEDLKWNQVNQPSPPGVPPSIAWGPPNYHYHDRSFVEIMQFEGPELKQYIGGDFIEIYNNGDTINVLNQIRVSDSLDSEGNSVPENRRDLRLHRLDPHCQGSGGGPGGGAGGGPGGGSPSICGATGSVNGELKPNQVGLILEPGADIDTEAIGWRDNGIEPFLIGKDIDNDGRGDTIRVFTTNQPNGEFMTGGMYDDTMETYRLHGPGADQVVLNPSSSWSSNCAQANRSCFKVDPEAANTPDSWNFLSRLEGTPGRIHTVDDFNEQWGWGGSITLDDTTLNLDEPICVPSMSNCPEPLSDKSANDLGFFEFVRIEDESGKLNLLHPAASNPDVFETSLRIGGEDGGGDDPDIDGRSFLGAFGTDPAPNVVADTTPGVWMSPGGMLRYEGVKARGSDYSYNALDEYEHIYTTLRPDTDNRRVNINTAPYEALKGIQINPASLNPAFSSEPTFMTQGMAEGIINHRNCQSYSNGDTIPEESYDCGSQNPFSTIERACQYINTNFSDPIDCETLHENAKVWSGGIFNGVVKSGVFENGEISGRAKWQVFIDRRGVNEPGGSLRVLFQRRLK